MTEALPSLNVQPRQPLQSQVYAALRQAIIDGRLTAGTKLVEGQIASHLGVSRNPVREALRKLEQEGLVIHNPNHGVTVSEVTRQQGVEIAAVREVLEALGCRLAAAHATAQDVAELRSVLKRSSESAAAGDLDQLVATDSGFHEHLARMSGNATLARILADLGETAVRFRRAAVQAPDRPEQTIVEHALIVDALEKGDAAIAESNMREHIRQAGLAFLASPASLPPTQPSEPNWHVTLPKGGS